MPDLLSILSTAASSLAAQRAAAATASNNLQNANTPGYARQTAVIAAALPAERVAGAYVGMGAVLQTVTQARDRFLEAQLPIAQAQSARSGATSDVLGAVSVLDPESTGGIGDALSGFYSAFSALSQNPSDASLRQAAVAAAQTLATSFNQTRASLEAARTGVDARLQGSLGEANQLAQQLASLNAQIRTARAAGTGEPNDLLDARQATVDQLARLTGASPVPTSQGDVSMFLSGGGALVSETTAGTLSALPDAANGNHLALQLRSGGVTGTVSPGGELGGLVDARDGALRTAVTSLDAIASALATQVNAAHAAGYGLDGSHGLALFTMTGGGAGAASQIQLNTVIAGDPRALATASAAGQPGDGGAALALVATRSTAVAALGNVDVFGALAQTTSAFGTAAQNIESISAQDQTLLSSLQTRRESVSGVSIDDELVNLQKAQRAFEAISKVIQTSSEMFDTLLQLK